jgi:hypothetical protein
MRLTAAAVGGFLAISTSFAAMAQNALPEIPAEELAKLDAICAQTACRPDKKMILNLDAKRTMEANFARTPYVDKNGVLFAYPGEMLVFKVEADGKTIRPPVFVRLEQVPVGDVSTLDDRGRKAATDHDKDHPEAMAQYLADIKAGMGMNTRLEIHPPPKAFLKANTRRQGKASMRPTISPPTRSRQVDLYYRFHDPRGSSLGCAAPARRWCTTNRVVIAGEFRGTERSRPRT